MAIFDALPVAFPWYDKLEKQNRFKENVDKTCDYKLISPSNAMLPFQFRRIAASSSPVKWTIVEANTDNEVRDITVSLDTVPNAASYLHAATAGGYDYFYYDGQILSEAGFDMTPLDFGYYYSIIEMNDGSKFYSEMFHVPSDSFTISGPLSPEPGDSAVNYLRCAWWNDCDISPIFYNDREETNQYPVFRQVVYLDTFVHASEPEFTVDGPKDGEDETIPTFQKCVIRYRIQVVVPDYLKRALAIMPMHDRIEIMTQKGVDKGEIEKVEVSSALEAAGALSTVDIVFTQDLAVVKKGCCDNMEKLECDDFGALVINDAEYHEGPPPTWNISGNAGGAPMVIIWVNEVEDGGYNFYGQFPASAFQSEDGIPLPEAGMVVEGNFFKVQQASFNCRGPLSSPQSFQ